MPRLQTPRIVVLATLCLTLLSCRWETPGLVEAPEETEPPRTLPKEIHWSRNSAEHRAAYLQIFQLATSRVEELAAERKPGTWAVSVDADETSIDNSLFNLEIADAGFFDEETWITWVKRQDATPQPGVIAFLERVQELGGKVAVVTNRKARDCPDTEAVFKRRGIPYDHIFCRKADIRDKNPRWERIQTGRTELGWPPLEILVWVGDNIIDFPGLDQSVRLEPDGAFGAFGDRYFILPNPMYGSWEDNPAD